MKYRPLGTTGISTSVIGLGTHQFSGDWVKQFSEEDVDQILGAAKDAGINLIDTAECYGASETLIGKRLIRERKDWIVATKFGHVYKDGKKVSAWRPGDVVEQLEASLKALQTDYIDIYQFHSGSNEEFDTHGLWEELARQVTLGKIRFLGISVSHGLIKQADMRQLQQAKKVGAQVAELVYNRLERTSEEKAFPLCSEAQLGVLARIPLARGFLSGTYTPGAQFAEGDIRSKDGEDLNQKLLTETQEILRTEVPEGTPPAQWALAWCLKTSKVSSVLVGCKTPAQVVQNAAAANLSLE